MEFHPEGYQDFVGVVLRVVPELLDRRRSVEAAGQLQLHQPAPELSKLRNMKGPCSNEHGQEIKHLTRKRTHAKPCRVQVFCPYRCQ